MNSKYKILNISRSRSRQAKYSSSKGSTLFFAIMITSLVLTVGLAIAQVIVAELKMGTDFTNSQNAYYAAEKGLEAALLRIRTESSYTGQYCSPESGPPYEYCYEVSNEGSNKRIAVKGMYLGVFRSLSVVSSSSGCSPTYSSDTLLANWDNNTVLEKDSSGATITTITRTLPDSVNFSGPHAGKYTSDNNILIADEGNHRVVKMDRSGNILWQYGQTGQDEEDHGYAAGYLSSPQEARELCNGNILITDGTPQVIEVDPDNQSEHSQGTVVWRFGDPQIYAMDDTHLDGAHRAHETADGHILISDGDWRSDYPPSWWPVNHRVIKVTHDAAKSIVWRYGESAPYELQGVEDAEEVNKGGEHYILIAEGTRHRILKIDYDSKNIVWQFGQTGAPGLPSSGRTDNPHSLEEVTGNKALFTDDNGAFTVTLDSSKTIGNIYNLSASDASKVRY